MRLCLTLFFAFGFAVLATGCLPRDHAASGTAPQDQAAIPDDHNAQNALDWAGLYRGTLPCADCPGIEVALTLHPDSTYHITRLYQERPGATHEAQGHFNWAADGNHITLRGEENLRYKISENRIIQLDGDGHEITGPLAGHFILHKQPEGTGDDMGAVTERYWKLVELRGHPVAPTTNEAHIILKTGDHRVTGSGGCNRIMGHYELNDPERIRFSQMAATRMACLDGMELEQDFLRVLESADSYHLDGDRLVLIRARMAPLARFEAVYLR